MISAEGNCQSDKNFVPYAQPLEIQLKFAHRSSHHANQHPKHHHNANHHHHNHQLPNHQHHAHHHHMQQDISKYLDLQTLHPDWDFAKKHGQSTKPGKVKDIDSKEECICCLRQINKEDINLFENSKQLQFLGYGFPLYFIFMKYAMIILLLQIVNYTAIELYWSIDANYDFCKHDIPRHFGEQEVFCTGFMVFLSNISDSVSVDENILRLSSFVTLLISLTYVRDNFTKTIQYYDERETSYTDFSILIEKIPKSQELKNHQITIGQRIRSFFGDTSLFKSELNIKKINLIGQFEEFEELASKKKMLIHTLADYEKKKHQQKQKRKSTKKLEKTQLDPKIQSQKTIDRSQKKRIYEEISHLNHEIQIQKAHLKKKIELQDLNCDKAIVCFEHQSERNKALKEFTNLTNEQLLQYFQTDQITIRRAPQPHEINWEYVNIPATFQIRRIIISWVIFIITLGSLTVGIYFLLNFKSHQVASADVSAGIAIVLCSLFGIIFFNKFILAYIIHHLVEFQEHKTGESAQFSLMLKYSIGLFFTTAVMTVLIQGATNDNVFKEHYGIIEEQTIMFFLNSFFVPLLWFINPWYLWKRFQRKLHQNSHYITQEDANKLMEDPQYLMGKRYGEVLESMWFTYLYSCVIPFGSILIFIGSALYYWVDKYNLLRKSSIQEGVSGGLCMKALFLLEFILILKPAGQLIFDGLIRHQWNAIPIIEICVGAVYLMLPMSSILSCLHQQKFLDTKISYTQLREENFWSYQLYNPISKEEELKLHFEKIENCSDDFHPHSLPNITIQKPLTSLGQIQIGTRSRKGSKKHSIVRPHKPSNQLIQQSAESEVNIE